MFWCVMIPYVTHKVEIIHNPFPCLEKHELKKHFWLIKYFWHLTTAWTRRWISTLFLPGKESIMRYKWFNKTIFKVHIHLFQSVNRLFLFGSIVIAVVYIMFLIWKWSRSIKKFDVSLENEFIEAMVNCNTE